MNDIIEGRMDDPADAARYQALAVLLGQLRTENERRHFASLYRSAVRDEDALMAMAGLLDGAATLWSREEARPASRQLVAVA